MSVKSLNRLSKNTESPNTKKSRKVLKPNNTNILNHPNKHTSIEPPKDKNPSESLLSVASKTSILIKNHRKIISRKKRQRIISKYPLLHRLVVCTSKYQLK